VLDVGLVEPLTNCAVVETKPVPADIIRDPGHATMVG